MGLKALISDMARLEDEMGQFEIKYGVKSSDFHQAMITGELEEFDALDDFRMEFVEWLALYKSWLSLSDKYQQLISRQPVAIQIKTAVLA